VCTIKCHSIIFGVTLRLLVINTSSSSRANNKRRRYTSDECHQLATVRFVVFITPCGRSGTTRDEARYWPKIAIFAARRSVSVVRPSVTFVYFVKTNKHIFNFFHDQEPHHSSFSLPNVMAVFQPDPNWGVEVRWGRQKSLFSTNRIDDCWSAINSWRLPCSV